MATAQIRIGTSGWNYDHWRKRFYPQQMPQKQYLEFYAQHFNSVEIDYSFYKLPTSDNFKAWAEQVPTSFVFAVKASRYLTHMRKLHESQEPWERILGNALHLERHLGPILLQFPANWKRNDKRLSEFLEMAKHHSHRKHLKLVFEFRNKSWFAPTVYNILRQYKAALCIADSDRWPRQDTITTDFTYFRFHGHRLANYSGQQLSAEAKKILKLQAEGIETYAYFNNDTCGYAIKNAKTVIELLSR